MTQTSQTRREGVATGFGKLSFPGGIDNRDLKPNRAALQARKRLRRQRLVGHLHRLGPAPLGHFLHEVELTTESDVTARLERYAEIDLEFVRALGGHRFAPSLHCIDGGAR
jgi:hypothetical protein